MEWELEKELNYLTLHMGYNPQQGIDGEDVVAVPIEQRGDVYQARVRDHARREHEDYQEV